MLRMVMLVPVMAMILFSESSSLAQSKKRMNENQIKSSIIDHTIYFRTIRTQQRLAAVYHKPGGTYKFYCCEENGWRFESVGSWTIENDDLCGIPTTGDRAGKNVCRRYYESAGKIMTDEYIVEKVVKGEE